MSGDGARPRLRASDRRKTDERAPARIRTGTPGSPQPWPAQLLGADSGAAVSGRSAPGMTRRRQCACRRDGTAPSPRPFPHAAPPNAAAGAAVWCGQ